MDVSTDPLVVLHTKTGSIWTNFEQELSKAFQDIMGKIDEIEVDGLSTNSYKSILTQWHVHHAHAEKCHLRANTNL